MRREEIFPEEPLKMNPVTAKTRPPNEIGLSIAHLPPSVLPFLDRLATAARRRWWVLVLAALVGGAAGIAASRLLPPWYESNASYAVIPIDDPTVVSGADSSAAIPLFSHVLVSRRAADETVQQLDLVRAYSKATPEAARAELMRHVNVSTDRKANVVVLSVEDRMPSRAQMIANTLGEVARGISTEIWSARTGEHRKRLETRLAEISKALKSAEEAMRTFRERERVVDLPEQIKASVAEAAFLERLKTEKRIGLHFAQGFGGAESPEVRRSQLEAGGAQQALQGLVHGGLRNGPLLALDALPRLEEENGRLKRDIDVNSATYELLARQVEQLRAVEARSGGRAELVDAPVEPRERSRPSLSSLVMGGTFLGLLLGLFLVAWPRAWVMQVRPGLPVGMRRKS